MAEEPVPVCGMSQKEFYDKLVSCGIPGLDAELIGYGALKKKTFTWQNDQDVSDQALASANTFLSGLNAGIKVEASPARFGKTIWEVKVLRQPAPALPP